MAHFNLNEYQTVQERIEIFRELFPKGRIVNEIVLINEKEVVMKSSVYLDLSDPNPVAVDFAQETVGGKGVNATSWVENCSTSATGRSLALLAGGMSPKGKKPSRSEMQKVARATSRDFMADLAALVEEEAEIAHFRLLWSDAAAAGASQDTLKAIAEFATVPKAD